MTEDCWYVYMLCCQDKTLYTGICKDVQRRVDEHNNDDKLAARYTRVRRPVTLVYQEEYGSRSEAARREAAVKKLARRDKLELIKQVAS